MVSSMTAFASTAGDSGALSWRWDVRSVNARGLDLRVRCPSGHERLEPMIRERVGKRVTRGSMTVSLQIERRNAPVGLTVNRDAAALIAGAAKDLAREFDLTPPTSDGVLAVRGVVEASDPESGADEAIGDDLMASLETALDQLMMMRRDEGQRLAGILVEQLDQLQAAVSDIEAAPARQPEAIRDRLAEALSVLVENGQGLDPDRLHQEAVLLFQKGDVREELDRLGAHIDAARELIAANGPVGRKLDFLTQELNRETNTICSKSQTLDITRIGLDMKSTIDQFREQVQNIE